MTAFSQLRIVEIEGSVAGAYCAKLFAENGASVTVVPDAALRPAERTYLHQHKRLIAEVDQSLLDEADVIIESSARGPLGPPVAGSDAAVRVRLSPYGEDGPCAAWRSTDLIAYAHGGHLHLTGDPHREPLSAPPNTPGYATGLFGFIGAMAGLIERERSGTAPSVDIATHEVLVALHQLLLMRYQLGHDVLCRMGNRYTGQGQPNALYQAADGWVAITAPTEPQVETICTVTGGDHLLEHPLINSVMDFQRHPELLDDHLVPWIRARTMDEVVELLQAVRVPAAPAVAMLQLLGDQQLAHRHYWSTAPVDSAAAAGPAGRADTVTVPGRPFRFSGSTGVGRSVTEAERSPPAQPLAGVRVLDLCRVWAGPMAARILAELGAEVIQVEAPWGRGPKRVPDSLVEATRLYPDNDQGTCQWNRNGHLIKYGLHKKSVVLDLTHERGAAVFERLAAASDVVIENYSPRVMPQLGLDAQRLHEVNPSLVYMTMPGYGRSGPARDWVAYGTTVDSHAGLSHLIGYPGQVPWKNGVAWPDPVAGLHAVSAILIALWRRGDDGGVTIEGAQFEATLTLVGDAIVEAQLRGQEPPVLGNRHPTCAPQGVYPTTGHDRWLALSVPDDDGWQALVDQAGLAPELGRLDLAARRRRHDELDELLARWTSKHEAEELARRLQDIGVAAAPVLDAPGLLADPQLAARGALCEIDQPEATRFRNSRLPVHFSTRPRPEPLRPAALLGEHNLEVLTGVAGLTPAEIQSLEIDGVVATEPPQ